MSTLPHFFLMAWRRLAGLPEEYSYPPCEKPLSKEFVQLMKNRLVTGALRYGPYRNKEHGREQVHAGMEARPETENEQKSTPADARSDASVAGRVEEGLAGSV